VVAAAETAEGHDFAAGEAGEHPFHVIHIVATYWSFVRALGEGCLKSKKCGVEVGNERILAAAAEAFGQRRLPATGGGMLELVENLVERAVHQMRVRVGEGGRDRGRAQTGRPLGMEGCAVSQE
jgi:hypothetical protein